MTAPVSDTGSLDTGVPASDGDQPRPAQQDGMAVTESTRVRRARLRERWSHPLTRAGVWTVSVCLGISTSWLFLQSREPSVRAPHSTVGEAASQRDSGTTTDPAGVVPLPRRLSGGTAQMTHLVDRRAGYELQYPREWTTVPPPSPGPEVLSSHLVRVGQSSAFSITSFHLAHPVTTTNLSDLRAVTDAILSTPEAKLVVLDVREVKVGGLPAVYYLYYFPDGSRRGIHAHYFVFDGNTMHTLVFQVVPDGEFAKYAAQFDQVVASFKSVTH